MTSVSTPQTPPRLDAQVGQAVVGFGLRENRQPDAQLRQQQAAVFPVAEVQRDEQRAVSALSRGADDFQFTCIGQPVLHRHTAFDAPQIHHLRGEFAMKPARGFFGGRAVAGKERQKILHHHFATLAVETANKIQPQIMANPFTNPTGRILHKDQSEPPQTGAIESGLSGV